MKSICLKTRGQDRNAVNKPRDELDAARLETRPARLLDLGRSLGELVGRQLARPIGLHGLFHLTVGT